MKKEQKGITLIALIITIIVMLILVGVTINVALNGGLFDKAKTASDQTNLAKEKEILQTKALGYLNNDGYVDLAEYVSKESPLEGYTLTNNTTYVTASKGTNTFYITKQGGITDQEPQAAPVVTGTRYTLKADPSSVLEDYDGLKNVVELINDDSTELLEIFIEKDDEDNSIYYINMNHMDLVEDDIICAYIYSISDVASWDGVPVNIVGESWNKITIGENGPEAQVITSSYFPTFEGFSTLEEKYDDNVYMNVGQTMDAVNNYFGEIFVLTQ